MGSIGPLTVVPLIGHYERRLELQTTIPVPSTPPKRASEKHARDLAAPAVRPLYLRLPWTPLLISAAVLLSGGFAVPPVRDAATLADVVDGYLVRPIGYILIAPLSNVFDMLTLLSLKQHIALVLGILVLFVLWRVARAVFGDSTRRQHLLATATLLVGIGLVYVAGTLLPRPMAALIADNANIMRVDFHSHTRSSHDGHQSVEQLRSWHAKAGYDVAYVTDHGSVAAAERGIVANPDVAANGVTLLQGIEVTWNGEHVTILGAERFYRGLLTENKRDVDVRGLELSSLITGREPVIVWNHPHQLDRLAIASGPGTGGVRAIELVNGAPDDIDAMRRNRGEIIALADQRNLALTAGSDSHGWGFATPGWTLMRIFGWRGMSGDSLAGRIERTIREGGRGSTLAVERRVADPGNSTVALGITAFAAPARMLTTVSNDERVSWLIWTWLIAAVVWWTRKRRPRPV